MLQDTIAKRNYIHYSYVNQLQGCSKSWFVLIQGRGGGIELEKIIKVVVFRNFFMNKLILDKGKSYELIVLKITQMKLKFVNIIC